jgi:serine protease Do
MTHAARILVNVIALVALGAMPVEAAVLRSSTEKVAMQQHEDAGYQALVDAANAVVGVKVKAIANARSNETLGAEREGSGVLIGDDGLVLTIGYLIMEADQVEVTDSDGATVPAVVVAYDHATGFGVVRPMRKLKPKPIRIGSSAPVSQLDRLMIVTGGEEQTISTATVVSRRQFAGYWEYLIDGAIFTAPPRLDHSGAALINKDGELVGIGSLFVMDAMTPGERLPGNMFVPIDLLKPILAEMIATGRQRGGVRPWLGLSSLEEDGRIKVLRVSDDGPADLAGITPGDIILQMGGRSVERLDDFYRRLWSAGAPGVEVSLKVLHGTEVREVKLRSIDRVEMIRKKPTI